MQNLEEIIKEMREFKGTADEEMKAEAHKGAYIRATELKVMRDTVDACLQILLSERP